MKTEKIGTHEVQIFEAIDEMPVARFHRFNKMLLIDAGIGSDLSDSNKHIEKAMIYARQGDGDKAVQELENLRQLLFFAQAELSPRNLAFAALVLSVDGQPCDDLSDEGLRRTAALFADISQRELTAQTEAVKKKIDTELQMYFPTIFADSQVKEYYDLLRRRTLAVLGNIIEERTDTTEVQRLTDALLTFHAPQSFSGSASVEVGYDKQFESMCLLLSERYHLDSQSMTVRAYYNAFERLREQMRDEQRRQRRKK